ncbi:MAG: hypothetical protein FJX61_09145 [Alphaproteobacteria bacterium]|nr:hypothetical protein [Alphaproteobacteria bacterium]
MIKANYSDYVGSMREGAAALRSQGGGHEFRTIAASLEATVGRLEAQVRRDTAGSARARVFDSGHSLDLRV